MICKPIDYVMGFLLVGSSVVALLLDMEGAPDLRNDEVSPPLIAQEVTFSSALYVMDDSGIQEERTEPPMELHTEIAQSTVRQEPIISAPPPANKDSEPQPLEESIQVDVAEAADAYGQVDEGNEAVEPTPVDLKEVLAGEAAKTFRELVAEGYEEIEEGEWQPAYGARMSERELDTNIRNGLACVVAAAGKTRWFIFDGTLSLPGRPRPMVTKDLANFSLRGIRIKGPQVDAARDALIREFGFEADDVAVTVLLAKDLDAAVLAAQTRAARSRGLTISSVSRTEGHFERVGDYPFRYVVDRVLDKDGNLVRAGQRAGDNSR